MKKNVKYGEQKSLLFEEQSKEHTKELSNEQQENSLLGNLALERPLVIFDLQDEGRKKYDQRFGMVEPVFANIRYQKRMNRFGLRGKEKVDIQWMLYCLVHNIEKCIPFDINLAFSPAI